MKGTKGLLILTLPLMAVGCSGSSSTAGGNSPPPPPTVDAQGIFEGTAGNGDSLIGIVAADGAAAFLEFPTDSNVPPVVTQGEIIIPNTVSPNADGAFNSTFAAYDNGGFTLPSGDAFASKFSGTATAQNSISGSYLTNSGSPVIFSTDYDAANYEVDTSSQFVGTYSATFNIGSQADTATVIIDDQGGVSIAETAYGCNYSGAWAIPSGGAGKNAYEIAFGAVSVSDCVDAHGLFDNMQGLSAMFNSGATIFAILSDKATGQGMFMTLTKTG